MKFIQSESSTSQIVKRFDAIIKKKTNDLKRKKGVHFKNVHETQYFCSALASFFLTWKQTKSQKRTFSMGEINSNLAISGFEPCQVLEQFTTAALHMKH